jgi:hypothetical protein
MLIIAASNSPEQVAWAAFDDAALRLHRMYATADLSTGSDADRARRLQMAIEVARLWDEWRELFLAGGDEPRPAA